MTNTDPKTQDLLELSSKNQIQNCIIDYPQTGTPWRDPTNPFSPQPLPVYPGIGAQPYQRGGIEVLTTTYSSPSRWSNTLTATHLILSIDLPGVKKLDVYVERGVLYVSAKRHDNGMSVNENFSLSSYNIDHDSVTATFDACVLEVKFLKKKPERIQVKITEK